MAQHPFSTRRGKAFRDRIMVRDHLTCQMCGALVRSGRKDGQSAVVDHMKPTELRPDLVFDPENCRTCCKACDHQINRTIENRARRMRMWTVRGADWIATEKRRYRFITVDGTTPQGIR